MPTIAIIYGIVITMYWQEGGHNTPHIHAKYGESSASFSIETGDILAGSIDKKKARLVSAWIALHEETLMENWKLAREGKPLFKVDEL